MQIANLIMLITLVAKSKPQNPTLLTLFSDK
jgi:hypothetical protein